MSGEQLSRQCTFPGYPLSTLLRGPSKCPGNSRNIWTDTLRVRVSLSNFFRPETARALPG